MLVLSSHGVSGEYRKLSEQSIEDFDCAHGFEIRYAS